MNLQQECRQSFGTNKENIEGTKRTVGAVEEIEELIGITGIHRMEAYDISILTVTSPCIQ